MPVIGRLDGQVDELIIRPISERRRGEEAPADSGGKADAQQAPPPPRPPTPTHTQTADESSAEADELPVWLL